MLSLSLPNKNIVFSLPLDGSSTERGPSTTTASASASNSTSWANSTPSPSRSQPQPTASPLPRPGGELCFALLSSLTAAERCWRSPGLAASQQPHATTTNQASPICLIVPSTGPHPAVWTLLLRLSKMSVHALSTGKQSAGPEVLLTVLLIKIHCTCINNASLLMFVRGQSVEKVLSCSPRPSPLHCSIFLHPHPLTSDLCVPWPLPHPFGSSCSAWPEYG